MADFIRVARVAEVPTPGKLLVEADGRLVVVFRAGDKWYCLDDVCTHDGGPLSEGTFDAECCAIACPRHGARFDVRDGRALSMPATRATKAHRVEIRGDDVFVQLAD